MKTNTLKEQKSPVCVQHNFLIEAKHDLTATEDKILSWLASQIKPDDEDFEEHTLSVKHFGEMTETQGAYLYQLLEETALSLAKRTVTIRVVDSNDYIHAAWLGSIKYINGEGLIKLIFNPCLKRHLIQLRKHFTMYDLKNVMLLKSEPSIRLYKSAKRHEYLQSKIFHVEIEQLRGFFGFEKTQYPKFKDLKRRVIDPSVCEINQKTDVSLECETIKKAKKIVSVKFLNRNKKCIEDKKFQFDEEPLPVSRIFNEITGANKRVSAIKEQEFLRTIKSHNLPGHLLENWRTGLTNAMEDLFYSGKISMKKGDEKGKPFKLTIRYAADNLPDLLAITPSEKEKKSEEQAKNSFDIENSIGLIEGVGEKKLRSYLLEKVGDALYVSIFKGCSVEVNEKFLFVCPPPGMSSFYESHMWTKIDLSYLGGTLIDNKLKFESV